MGLESPRAEDKKDIPQKKTSLLRAAAFAATLSGLAPHAAEAGGFTEQSVPEVARVEQELHAAGLPELRKILRLQRLEEHNMNLFLVPLNYFGFVAVDRHEFRRRTHTQCPARCFLL